MKLTVNYRDVIGGVPADVQVLVEETKPDGTTFQDALYYPTIAAHDAAAASGDRDAAAQQRVDNYVAATIAKPVDAVQPDTTEQQELASLDSLRETAQALLEKIDQSRAAKEATIAIGVALKG